MKILRKLALSIILTALITSTQAFGYPANDDTILEITDRYKEVKLGLTTSSVYMVIDEKTRSYINNELQNQYNKDLEDFNDSEGNFIPSEHTFLQSNVIEIAFDDFDEIKFINGSLKFNYSKNVSFHFENIVSTNGNKALDNFYLEDLELFYRTLLEVK